MVEETAGAPAGELTVQLMVAEYGQLKQEQRDCIRDRDNLIYTSLLALAAVATATAASGARALLLLPPVSAVLGWTYLVNDAKVSAIGRYLRADLAVRLGAAAGRAGVFGWETTHRADTRRVSRKRLQLAVDLLTFCLLPAAGLVVYWCAGPWPLPLLGVSAADTALVAVLAAEIVRYADLAAETAAAAVGEPA